MRTASLCCARQVDIAASTRDAVDDATHNGVLKRLLSERNLAYVATLMPDGSPQVTPVWAGYDDGLIMVNTAEGRVKHQNILRDARVAVSVTSADDPLQMVSVRGVVEEVVPDHDYVHADILTRRYMPGRDRYPFRRPGERRIILAIRPVRVYVMPKIQETAPGN